MVLSGRTGANRLPSRVSTTSTRTPGSCRRSHVSALYLSIVSRLRAGGESTAASVSRHESR